MDTSGNFDVSSSSIVIPQGIEEIGNALAHAGETVDWLGCRMARLVLGAVRRVPTRGENRPDGNGIVVRRRRKP